MNILKPTEVYTSFFMDSMSNVLFVWRINNFPSGVQNLVQALLRHDPWHCLVGGLQDKHCSLSTVSLALEVYFLNDKFHDF